MREKDILNYISTLDTIQFNENTKELFEQNGGVNIQIADELLSLIDMLNICNKKLNDLDLKIKQSDIVDINEFKKYLVSNIGKINSQYYVAIQIMTLKQFIENNKNIKLKYASLILSTCINAIVEKIDNKKVINIMKLQNINNRRFFFRYLI